MVITARRRYRHATGQAIGLPLPYFFPFDLFTLFVCTTRATYATLAMCIGRSLRGAERSLRFFHPLTRCARYATCIDTHSSSARSLTVPALQVDRNVTDPLGCCNYWAYSIHKQPHLLCSYLVFQF